MNAAVSKTVNVTTAGTLSTQLTTTEMTSVTNPTVTGNIDARDFKFMRDGITNLAVLDISGVNVQSTANTTASNVSTAYTGRKLRSLGDSFTAGYRATNFYGYVDMLCAELGTTKYDSGIAGGQIVDIAYDMVDSPSNPNDIVTILPGFNDCAQFGDNDSDGRKLLAYKNALSAIVAGMSIPESSLLRGTSSSISYAGTWSSTKIDGVSSYAKYTNVNGATATFNVTGDVLYVNYVQQLGNSSSFSVSVDGVVKATQLSAGYVSNGGAISSRFFESALLRVTGLGSGNHTVILTAIIPDTAFYFFLQWVSGVPSTCSPIYLAHPCKENATGSANMASAGYGHYTSASHALFKQASKDIVSELNADGLNLRFVDTDSYSEVYANGEVDADNIHPNDTGHQIIYNAFLSAILEKVSLTTLALESVNICPNPVTDGFQIDGLEGTGTLTLADLSGKVLLTKRVKANEYVSVSYLPQGIYIIKIATDKGTIERKVLKK